MSKDNKAMARLRRPGQRAASRFVVRSALNPMIWLCAINTPSFLLAAYAFKDHAILSTLFGLIAAVPVLVTCVVAIFFGVSKTEKLRSGGYQLRRDMLELRQIEHDVLANGKVDGPDLEVLRRQLYVNGKIDRRAADFLVELHKRVQHRTPAFEQFFYQAIKDHILADGRIDAEEAAWLRQMLFADGKIDDEERQFLHELKGEARQVSHEFEALFAESMKQPPEQRTSG